MSNNDNTMIYIIGGVGLLWLLTRNYSPAAVAANTAALQQTAALQSAQIAANAQTTNIQTGANLVSNLVDDFTGDND